MADGEPVRMNAPEIARERFRYYDFVMAAFCVVLVLSNVVGAAKVATLGGMTFGAGILFFPISYVIGDVLTEVYGYARARRVIWAGFGASVFAAVMCWVIVVMPPAPGWSGQDVYEAAFGQVWRIVGASVIAFWAGEFVNSYVLARMKIWTGGRLLWTRTIGSTIFGQGIDSLIFYPLAFWGVWTPGQVLTVMVTNWWLKVFWEAALTPLTYVVVGFLKRREGIDVFDAGTDFTPFRTRV
ncbi:queuosine precursor transporter [Sphingomonas sp.]|uniref:queuosine precursor transporter n=1 Tax=Sphingomonas sp. TaxID=28214 RepID=UPI001EC12E54|nr:queuosine precursor transporter [Sphingomonas sp.]MBX3594638.1 queuosine precursor transporter [Sphingomonas sp.]